MRKWKPTQEQKEMIKALQEKEQKVVCGACNGSGYYDDKGSPKCGACGGLGSVRSQSS